MAYVFSYEDDSLVNIIDIVVVELFRTTQELEHSATKYSSALDDLHNHHSLLQHFLQNRLV